MYFDPMYFVFAVPPLLFGLWAQWKVKSAFGKYSNVANSTGYTGADIARRLLDSQGLRHVSVEAVPGELTDHYDPRAKVVRLSEATMYRNSVAAIGVVAHEVGHAIQDAENYAPMRTRAAILPVANIGSILGPYIFMLGIFINMFGLALLGLLLFGAAALFQAVTLPVEYNASNRAMRLLVDNGLVTSYDAGMARQVLDAAALTYVAALLQSLAQVLYYAMLLSGNRRRDD
ncbi:MAG: zinc metallopeptidase [Chloroflexi bacterium]|jgi:Zn-dependent membrane protease YugP|nr:zinc metallopeptidase [Chloroflexota bacterium]